MRIPAYLCFLIPAAFFLGPAVKAQEAEDLDPFSDKFQAALEEELVLEEKKPQQYLEPGKVRMLNALAKPSIVTVRQLGRDGENRGTGSGFVISKDGLIVTNLHVIGEGRSIEVEFVDGSVFPVIEVHAFDRYFDLAVLKIDPKTRSLEALKLADSSALQQGDLIVGFGAPQGLSFSVVAGVLSAIRELDPGFIGEGETPSYPMLQLAMPIEQGNSGGPVLNLDGEVIGVVTLRHRVTENLGFAVQSNDLNALVKKPNPMPMSRWRTIGVLDDRLWTTVMGGDWTQRGGVITARNRGDGFGGRALCLSGKEVPKIPYEAVVKVRLADESGAAGIAFAANGDEKHYGFYPTGGKIRFTRFDGADVYSWTILEQFETAAYRRDDWNELRVRVEERLITGWINGEKVLEMEEDGLRGGQVGLCKFRDTVAEFRGFDIGLDLGRAELPIKERERLENIITSYLDGASAEKTADQLRRDATHGRTLLDERADELLAMAADLRELKNKVYRESVINDLSHVLGQPEREIDLFEVGLQISRIDDPEIDLDYYRASFAGLVEDGADYLDEHAPGGNTREKAEALRDFLFKENGFHGSRAEYYHHSNSYVNHVLDDREGLPITLSALFVEIARRLDIEGVFGAPLPGKFMVGLVYNNGDEKKTAFIDVFENGKLLSRSKAAREVWTTTGAPPAKAGFQPATAQEIAVRMLRNLVGLEINQRKTPQAAINYLEMLLAIQPDAAQERFQRALLRLQGEDAIGAGQDIDWLLENRPPGLDYGRLEAFRETLSGSE